jgi:2-amino-4-hydroxy-6-hydroxymethyldihydropteridine diphosphokinase
VEYAAWAPRYQEILSAFGFPREREELAARRLTALLPDAARHDPLRRISARLAGRTVIVAGRAPRLDAPPLWRLPAEDPRIAVIAADGATLRCLEGGVIPDVITTDLDGPVASEVAANARGSLVVIHAHGDNLPQLERWVPEFGGELAGSWAGPPQDGLLDVGGFTDGDRAAYLAEHVGARRILLWAFDFEKVDEAESAPRKLEKLAWARRLLTQLAEHGRAPIWNWAPDGSLHRYAGSAAESTQ